MGLQGGADLLLGLQSWADLLLRLQGWATPAAPWLTHLMQGVAGPLTSPWLAVLLALWLAHLV